MLLGGPLAAELAVVLVAICCQDCRSSSGRSDGAPGDRIAPSPVKFCIQPAGRPINTYLIKVLQRPVESALGTAAKLKSRFNCRTELRRDVGQHAEPGLKCGPSLMQKHAQAVDGRVAALTCSSQQWRFKRYVDHI